MKIENVWEKVNAEIARARRLYGSANAQRSPSDWVCVIMKQVGDAVAALGGDGPGWLAEELVQIAAGAILALEATPETVGATPVARIDRVDTDYPRIAGKVPSAPEGATVVATIPEGGEVYVGKGKVWINGV